MFMKNVDKTYKPLMFAVILQTKVDPVLFSTMHGNLLCF